MAFPKGVSPNPDGRPRTWTDEELHKLGKELIKFMEQDGVWHFTEFTDKLGKNHNYLHDLANQYPEVFSDYLTRVRYILGRKMFKYGMEKNPNSWMIKTFMPRFLGLEKEALKAVEKEEEAKEIGRQRAQEKQDKTKCIFNNDVEKIEKE